MGVTMFSALLLGVFVDTAGIGQRPMSCLFPSQLQGEAPIEVVLTPRPSLKDIPGLYRVEMALNGVVRLKAAAQPIAATNGRDVMVRATQDETTIYTVGIDDMGRAALNVVQTGSADAATREATRTGHCREYERYIKRWTVL